MEILHSLNELRNGSPFAAGIGFFDGLHLGHQAILKKTAALAAEKCARPVVITFFPHPASVLFPDRPLALLQTEREKEQALADLGMAAAVILRPSRAFLAEKAADFAGELAALPGLCGLVCGENFTFGAGAEGTPAFLDHYFEQTRIEIDTMPLMTSPLLEGGVISSTAVRRLLREGDVRRAAALLGRRYTLSGDVVHGFRRGTTAIGFPTANLSFGEGRVLPADGVYATYARIRGRRYPAVTNIGKNPTFGNGERTVETFIIHFDDHIYGEPFLVEFAERLRGEIQFESVDALRRQITSDVERARKILQAE